MRRGNMLVAKIPVGLNGRPLLLFADPDLCLQKAQCHYGYSGLCGGTVMPEIKAPHPIKRWGLLSKQLYFFSSSFFSFSLSSNFLSVGNKMISRIESWPVSIIIIRSIPIPIPPVGGIPLSIASM